MAEVTEQMRSDPYDGSRMMANIHIDMVETKERLRQLEAHVRNLEEAKDPWSREEEDQMTMREYSPVTIDERLGHLVEKCGKVLHAVGQAYHFGLGSMSPEPGTSFETNRAWILRELDDLGRACSLVRKSLDDSPDAADG